VPDECPLQRLLGEEGLSFRFEHDQGRAGTRIAPDHRDKPLAPGCGSALVVGVPGAALTGTRYTRYGAILVATGRGVAGPQPRRYHQLQQITAPPGGDDHACTRVSMRVPRATRATCQLRAT
jgi:hypothetical protein